MSASPSHLSLWETAKTELRNTLPRADFETWISSLQPLSIQEGKVLVLEAPSVLTEAWVNSNYGEVLRRQLTLVAGRNMDYRLTASVDPARRALRRDRLACSGDQGDQHLRSFHRGSGERDGPRRLARRREGARTLL
jgi:chromosomal replication initiation ATPase DnaA